MDGRLAILFGIMGFFGEGHEGEGWNAHRADVAGQLTTSAGLVQFQGENWGQEVRFTYNFPKWKKFNPVLDFSVTEKGGAWVGYGLYQQFDMEVAGKPFFIGFSSTPGIYLQGDDLDLGFPLLFRAGVELGVELGQDWRVSLSYDHRSNADITAWNPGIETLQLRVSRPFIAYNR